MISHKLISLQNCDKIIYLEDHKIKHQGKFDKIFNQSPFFKKMVEESLKYNKLVKNKNFNFSHEKLYRNDNIYDIILELNQNQNPSIRNKGSAIFIHCSFGDLRPTLGCVALKKNNLKFLINNLQKQNYIYIR